MINSQPGYENVVYEKILGISKVKSANRVFGAYDIILLIEDTDLESLNKTVAQNVRSIKEVIQLHS
jgi:DNA-binding Lrp family transcriptional regulator